MCTTLKKADTSATQWQAAWQCNESPLMFQALKTTMSISREEVEKPARIPAVATVSPVGCFNVFEQFIQPVFLRLARVDEIETRNRETKMQQHLTTREFVFLAPSRVHPCHTQMLQLSSMSSTTRDLLKLLCLYAFSLFYEWLSHWPTNWWLSTNKGPRMLTNQECVFYS